MRVKLMYDADVGAGGPTTSLALQFSVAPVMRACVDNLSTEERA